LWERWEKDGVMWCYKTYSSLVSVLLLVSVTVRYDVGDEIVVRTRLSYSSAA